jgi:poly(beta-D-mannuronate) lyase
MQLNMRFSEAVFANCNRRLTGRVDGLVTLCRSIAVVHPVLVAAVAGLGCFSSAAAALDGPFPVRLPDSKASSRPCAEPQPPVTSFAPISKYGQAGAARDQLDVEAGKAFEDAMKPVRAFSRDVVKAANDYHRTGRMSAAECAVQHLAQWSKADALASPGSHTAWFKLATTLSGLSLAYLQVKPALRGREMESRDIESWLNRRGKDVAQYFQTLNTPRSSRNNHRAWAGLAAAAAAAASGDKALLAQAAESFRVSACQATPAGALPMEVERGRKALEYHLYALAALTTLAEIGERNGLPLHKECSGALGRIAAFTLDAIGDPSRIAALAGVAQDPADAYLTPAKLVFLEPWAARHPDTADRASALLARRPLALTDLGGDQTLLYGRRASR